MILKDENSSIQPRVGFNSLNLTQLVKDVEVLTFRSGGSGGRSRAGLKMSDDEHC